MTKKYSASIFNLVVGLMLELLALLLYNPITNYFYNKGSWPVGPLILAVIYASGIYFIFRSDIKQGYKFALSYWWMLFVAWYGILAGLDYVSEWKAYRYETYLIPEGYHGKLEINFGKVDGDQPMVQDDEIILMIGKDGKLNSRYIRPQTRFFNDVYPRFFYVDLAGHRTPLKRVGEKGIKPEEVFVEFLKNAAGHREFLICTQAEHKAYF